MKCLHPVLVGWSFGRLANGKVKFVSVKDARKNLDAFDCIGTDSAHEIYAPCGKCPLCLKRRKRDIVTRIYHEFRANSPGWFVTLTYNQDSLRSPSLIKSDVQKFLKRLRKRIGSFRYVVCGEYGSKNLRPHFHLILFGVDFPDIVFHEHRGKYDLYRSPTIEKAWQFGFSTLSHFDYANARYVASYVIKKSLDNLPKDIVPPFFAGSKGKRGQGAFGAPYFDRFHQEMLRDGFAVLMIRGRTFKVPLPDYYLRRARDLYQEEWLDLISRREEYACSHVPELMSTAEYEQYIAELESEATAFRTKEKSKINERKM